MPTRQALDQLFMDIATRVSQMSYATRNRVGACIVKNENVLSIGYNGMPSGFPNNEVEYFENGALVTNPLVLHAESNAIAKCAAHGVGSTNGATVYTTLLPCRECGKLMVQAKISRLVYGEVYRDPASLELFERAGIEVVKFQGG